MLRLLAPAKINLTLEVLGKRPDGYHEVRTIMQAVSLADELTFEDAADLSLIVEPDDAVPVEGNLVLRAAEALRAGAAVTRGARISLAKRIPVAGGLGGGSSDAATTLLGLRKLWGLDVTDEVLGRIAGGLGSDVPFFLKGGTALAQGRGDELTTLPQPIERWAVIVAPRNAADTTKTSRLYGFLTPASYGDGGTTIAAVRHLAAGAALGDRVCNTFEAVAWQAHTGHESMCTLFNTTAAPRPLLSGAGPSMFALFESEEGAEQVRERMASEGYDAFRVTLLGAWGPGGLEV